MRTRPRHTHREQPRRHSPGNRRYRLRTRMRHRRLSPAMRLLWTRAQPGNCPRHPHRLARVIRCPRVGLRTASPGPNLCMALAKRAHLRPQVPVTHCPRVGLRTGSPRLGTVPQAPAARTRPLRPQPSPPAAPLTASPVPQMVPERQHPPLPGRRHLHPARPRTPRLRAGRARCLPRAPQ